MLSMMRLACSYLIFVGLTRGEEPIKKCAGGDCAELTIESGSVVFRSSGQVSERTVGPYLSADQHLVPNQELPIQEIKSQDGWRVIVTVSLSNYDFIGPIDCFWIFDPSGNKRIRLKGDYFLDQMKIGHLFDEQTDILAIETQGPHAYTVTSSLYLLSVSEGLTLLLKKNAQLKEFYSLENSSAPGVRLNVETYDGVHSETKGWKLCFWRWNPALKTLAADRQASDRK
jgi:hypothetical protein